MKTNLKVFAVRLRKSGFSVSEIAEKLRISKSTASLWLRDIIISKTASTRLYHRVEQGRLRGVQNKQAKIRAAQKQNFLEAHLLIDNNRNIIERQEISKIICALLYWCEGYKGSKGSLAFTNSDPRLVALFLKLFRRSFDLKEKKFRACLHLHPYHFEKNQIEFWSRVTKIPKIQFFKSFNKKNGGVIIRENYPGCISVRYHDMKITRQITSLAEVFMGA